VNNYNNEVWQECTDDYIDLHARSSSNALGQFYNAIVKSNLNNNDNKTNAIVITFNSDLDSWHYGWISNKHKSKDLHVFQVMVLHYNDNQILNCIHKQCSPQFCVLSSRRQNRKGTSETNIANHQSSFPFCWSPTFSTPSRRVVDSAPSIRSTTTDRQTGQYANNLTHSTSDAFNSIVFTPISISQRINFQSSNAYDDSDTVCSCNITPQTNSAKMALFPHLITNSNVFHYDIVDDVQDAMKVVATDGFNELGSQCCVISDDIIYQEARQRIILYRSCHARLQEMKLKMMHIKTSF
jgi:hypothetical protein